MKIWRKTKKNTFEKLIVGWRVRSISRFLSKIFSWLLGAFVIGLLTSIFFLALNAPHLSQPFARLLFFVFFILGVLSNYYRSIVNGLEYWVTPNAFVKVRPFCGFERLNQILGGKTYPFRTEYYYIPWDEIKSVKEENEHIELLNEKGQAFYEIPMQKVLKLFGMQNRKHFERSTTDDESIQKLGRDTRTLVVKTVNEIKKK